MFRTRDGAVQHAHYLARENGKGLSSGVPFAPGVYRAVEGGKAFEVSLTHIDWQVIEVDEAALARTVQRNMRLAVEQLNGEAKLEDAKSEKAASDTFVRYHRTEAARLRAQARDIETQLTVARVS